MSPKLAPIISLHVPGSYRPEIDGLRAISVLSVIFFHAGLSGIPGGFLGVDIFFVISGYLITKIIIADMQAGNFRIALFYERRIRRIVPALYLVIGISTFMAWVILLPADLIDFSNSLVASVVSLSNIVFWRQAGYFDAASELKPLLHTWSLAVEEQFYLFFPMLLLCLNKVKNKKISLLVLVSLMLVSFLASTRGTSASFYLAPFRAWELLAGALIAKLESETQLLALRLATKELLSAVGLGLVVFAVTRLDSKAILQCGTLLAVMGAVLIIAFSGGTKLTGRLLSFRLFVGVGLISYSLYLWHYPLLAFSHHYFGKRPEKGPLYSIIAITFILAWLTWKFIERPARNPQILQSNRLYLLLGVGTLVIVGAGLSIRYTDGFVNRYPEMDREIAKMTTNDFGDYVMRRFDLLAGRIL